MTPSLWTYSCTFSNAFMHYLDSLCLHNSCSKSCDILFQGRYNLAFVSVAKHIHHFLSQLQLKVLHFHTHWFFGIALRLIFPLSFLSFFLVGKWCMYIYQNSELAIYEGVSLEVLRLSRLHHFKDQQMKKRDCWMSLQSSCSIACATFLWAPPYSSSSLSTKCGAFLSDSISETFSSFPS